MKKFKHLTLSLLINEILIVIFMHYFNINVIASILVLTMLFGLSNLFMFLNKENKNAFMKYLSFLSSYMLAIIIFKYYFDINIHIVTIIYYLILFILKFKFDDKKNLYEYLFILSSFLIFSLFITSNSNSSPQGNNMTYTDSSVTKYMGKIMSEGRIPYIDGFDHKGLFLFVINFFAYIINEHWGIWLLENIAIYISLLFSYKFAKMITNNKVVSFLSVICSFLSIAYVYNGGSYSDEWDIPLIIISLYYFTKGLKNGDFKKIYSFIIGICCSLAFLLRPNIVLIWGIMAIFLLIKYIYQKEIKKLLKIILFFIIGNMVILIPSAVYLIINGAFSEFIYQCFVFNINYAQNWPSNYNIITIFKYFYDVMPAIVLASVILLIILIYNKNNRDYKIFYLILFATGLYIVMSPLNPYEHYAMILIPLLIYPFSKTLLFLFESLKCQKNLRVIILIMVIVSVMCKEINFIYNRSLAVINDGEWLVDIRIAIQENSNENDNVLVLGNECLLYLISNRTYHHKFFNSGITIIDDKLKDEFIEEVENDLPKLIVSNGDIAISEIKNIVENNYIYAGTYNPNYNLHILKSN